MYSSDASAPTLHWPSPGDGATINAGPYNVAVSWMGNVDVLTTTFTVN